MLKKLGILLVLVVAATAGWVGYAVQDIPSALTRTWEQPKGLLIDGVHIISMESESTRIQADRAVLIIGDRIAEIGAAGQLQAPAEVTVVQGNNGYLIPGLIDAHVHVSDEAELAAYLAHGVTGIRNMGGYPFHLPLQKQLQNGELIGPEFITTGPILNSHGPNENMIQQIVTTADEARAAVQDQHAQGYRTVKIYSNLTRDAFDAIVDEARRLNMGITGHSPEGVRHAGIPWDKPFTVPASASIGQGFTTLEHVETMVWHGLRDDLDTSKMQQLAAQVAAAGDVVTPTLIAHRRLVAIAESGGAYLHRPGSETINPFVDWIEKGSKTYWSEQDTSDYEAPHAAFFLQATAALHAAGVPLLAGTDAGGFGIIPGASLTRELELLVDAGLTPYEALATATRNAAAVLRLQQAGKITRGAAANLVLLKDNPLEDISNVENPIGVVRAGIWIDQQGLEALHAAARDTSFTRSAWRAVALLASL